MEESTRIVIVKAGFPALATKIMKELTMFNFKWDYVGVTHDGIRLSLTGEPSDVNEVVDILGEEGVELASLDAQAPTKRERAA